MPDQVFQRQQKRERFTGSGPRFDNELIFLIREQLVAGLLHREQLLHALLLQPLLHLGRQVLDSVLEAQARRLDVFERVGLDVASAPG